MDQAAGQRWTPKRIANWLRRYPDWRAEVDAEIGASGRATGDAGSSIRAVRRNDPTARTAINISELADRCRTVEWWLSPEVLSETERQAAEYWLRDDEGTITETAESLGWRWDVTKQFVLNIPRTIWARCYARPGQEAANG